jgi:hypothetical protein
MSELSDYKRLVSEPLERHLRAEISSLLDRLSKAEGERDDYRERLHDLAMIDSEEWATGGGPGFADRKAKAWDRAREPFEP